MDLEDCRNKLDFVDITVKCRCVTKLLDVALKKKPKNQAISSSIQIPEINLLWEACISDCCTTSMLACEGILSFVVNKQMDLEYAMQKFINLAQSSRNLFSPVYAITKLLFYENDQQDNTNEAHYSLQYPKKHPLISMLENVPESWPLVLDSILTSTNDSANRNGFAVMEPVFSYVCLSPLESSEMSMMRSAIFESLCVMAKAHPCEVSMHFYQIIPWLQVHNLKCVIEASNVICSVQQIMPNISDDTCKTTMLENLIFASLAVSSSCLQSCFNPLKVLRAAEDLIDYLPEADLSAATSASLILISSLLKESTGAIVQELLSIGHTLLNKRKPSKTVAAVMLIPLIQLLSEPKIISFSPDEKSSSSLSSLVRRLEECLDPLENINTCKNETDEIKMNAFEAINSVATCSVICANFIQLLDASNVEMKIRWLNHSKKIIRNGGKISNFFFHVIAGLFLTMDESPELLRACLDVLEVAALHCNQVSTQIFALLLYKQTIEVDPSCQLLIMEYLTRTACHKFSISPVLNVLQLMTKTPELKAQSICLMLQLWKKQDRCFPYLQKLLVERDRAVSTNTGVCEILIAQAAAIKELCLTAPEKYSGEFLAALSMIINDSNDDSSTPAAALALDSVLHLCKSEVIDLRSTWKALAQKLVRDKRPIVIIRMCHFLKLVPELQVKSFEYCKFMNDSAACLWRLICGGNNVPSSVISEAYQALSSFSKDCYNLKQMPPLAKVNLKLPASMAATPFEMGKLPEDVLQYIPGYCFVDLLKSIQDSVILEGYRYFLESLVRQEVEDLPREVYSHKRRVSKKQSAATVTSIPRVLCSKFQSGSSLANQRNLAVGILLSYESPLEYDKCGNPLKRSVAAHSRNYEQVLEMLLNEVNLDYNDWQRCLLVPTGWGAFIERMFFACEESRRAELDLQHSHGQLKLSQEEMLAVKDTAWLWVRDRIFDLICTSSKKHESSPSTMANTMFAVSGLVGAVGKFYFGLEDKAKKLAKESEKHMDYDIFQQQCTESILTAFHSVQDRSAKIFSWILPHPSKQSSSSGYLIKGCAGASLFLLVPTLRSAFAKKIPMLCDIFVQNLDTSSSPTFSLYAGMGVGLFIKALLEDGYVNDGNDQLNTVLKTVESLDTLCMQKELKSGNLIGLTLSVTAVSRNGNPALHEQAKNICLSFYDRIKEENPSSMEYEYLSVCTAAMIAGAAGDNIISTYVIDDLLQWFHDQQQKMQQCWGTAVSLGILMDALFHLGYAKSAENFESLEKMWFSILTSERKPTLQRIAALNGVCAMYSAGRGLVQINRNVETCASRLKDLVHLMSELLNTTKDTSLQSISCWELGRMFSIHSGQQSESTATSTTFSYLNERSILKPLSAFMQDIAVQCDSRHHLLVILKALSQIFPRPLPPLNWVSFLGPVLQQSSDSELIETALKVAMHQMTSAPTALALFTSYATPPIWHSLPVGCHDIMLKNLPLLASSFSPAKLQEFCKVMTISLITDEKSLANNVAMILQAMLDALKASSANKTSSAILKGAVGEIIQCLTNNDLKVFQLHLHLICKLLVQCGEEFQDSLYQSLEKEGSSYCVMCILCNLVKTGRKSLKSLRPFIEKAKYIAQNEQKIVIAAVLDCFVSSTKSSESDASKPEKCIAFLMETIGWIKVLLEAKRQCDKEVIMFLVDICLVAIVGSAGFEVTYTVWPVDTISHRFLMQSLPSALTILLHQSKWEECMGKIADWLLLLKWDPDLLPNDEQCIMIAFCAIRSSSAFCKASVWTEVVPRSVITT